MGRSDALNSAKLFKFLRSRHKQVLGLCVYRQAFDNSIGSVVEWLTHRTDDQHGLGSKPTCAILLCSWEKHFTALSPAWWS